MLAAKAAPADRADTLAGALPQHVLALVFSSLDEAADLASLRLACRGFVAPASLAARRLRPSRWLPGLGARFPVAQALDLTQLQDAWQEACLLEDLRNVSGGGERDMKACGQEGTVRGTKGARVPSAAGHTPTAAALPDHPPPRAPHPAHACGRRLHRRAAPAAESRPLRDGADRRGPARAGPRRLPARLPHQPGPAGKRRPHGPRPGGRAWRQREGKPRKSSLCH